VSNPLREDRGAALSLALLRATLVVAILVSEHLVDARELADSYFFVVLGVATAYALGGIVLALRTPPLAPPSRTLARLAPWFDVLLLTALTYSSGGAYSDARKAFFVIPLAAAFSERPRSTANWSLLAVGLFTLQAAVAGGHPQGAANTWQRLTLNQDLYLAWTGAAATLLAVALRRRTARIQELAQARQRLVAQAMDSAQRERTRLANALHDSPVQNLIAARLDLRRAERTGDRESFERLRGALDATIAELRREIFELHPHVLDHVGLRAALEQVARQRSLSAGVPVTVDIGSDAEFPHEEVLFALARELLSNAAKHARPSEIRLSISRRRGGVVLEVADDGSGIAEGRMGQALLEGHIGLAAVNERVESLNGRLSLTTRCGEGTTVRVTLPDPTVRLVTPASPRELDVSDRVTRHDTLRVSTARA
jgi:two-component system, NarL family, sensor kinase